MATQLETSILAGKAYVKVAALAALIWPTNQPCDQSVPSLRSLGLLTQQVAFANSRCTTDALECCSAVRWLLLAASGLSSKERSRRAKELVQHIDERHPSIGLDKRGFNRQMDIISRVCLLGVM